MIFVHFTDAFQGVIDSQLEAGGRGDGGVRE